MYPACDISKYQGAWQDYPADIVVAKTGGGDDGLYFDPDFNQNYTDAVAAGKHIGGYWFVGWSMGAVQEAARFLVGMAPKAENDVYALDLENGAVDVSASSPAYALAMAEYIHSQIGVWPIVYMNLSTLNSYDWSALLANCGLWLADWNGDPSGSIPTSATYIMQQYADGPVYDHDEYYGPSLASFDAYGYHASNDPSIQAQSTPAPQPTPPAPVTPPAPTPPVAVSAPPVTPTTPSTPTTPTPPAVKPPVLPDLVNKVPPVTTTEYPSVLHSILTSIWTFLKSLVKVEL